MIWTTAHLTEFESAIKELFDYISHHSFENGATIVCLHGNLGAGKTTATQIIARELGITDTVQSPTFVIKKIYQTGDTRFATLIHIDAYRLEHEDPTMLRLDEDFADSKNLVIIEWPEMITSVIPIDAVHIHIEQTGEKRIITL